MLTPRKPRKMEGKKPNDNDEHIQPGGSGGERPHQHADCIYCGEVVRVEIEHIQETIKRVENDLHATTTINNADHREFNKTLGVHASRLDVSKGSALAWGFIGSVLGTAVVAAIVKHFFDSSVR